MKDNCKDNYINIRDINNNIVCKVDLSLKKNEICLKDKTVEIIKESIWDKLFEEYGV